MEKDWKKIENKSNNYKVSEQMRTRRGLVISKLLPLNSGDSEAD